MKKLLLLVVVAATAGYFVRKQRAGTDDADLWAEATQAVDLR